MRTFKKALLWLTGGLLVAAAVLLAWVLLTWDRVYDDVANPQLVATTDPDVIAKGRYWFAGRLTVPTATSQTFKRWFVPTLVRNSR